MKDKPIEQLIEKYESGLSSKEDELYLIEHLDESTHELNPWFQFVKHHKTKTSENFNEELWESFENKTQSKRKLILGMLTAAASVLLFLALFLGNNKQETLSYEEKAALLNQAKNMLTKQKQGIAQQDIIYEDQNIIIYTTTE